jgi:hypothetical protein
MFLQQRPVSKPPQGLNLARNLSGDDLSAKIKNRKEEGGKVLKEGLKKEKPLKKGL